MQIHPVSGEWIQQHQWRRHRESLNRGASKCGSSARAIVIALLNVDYLGKRTDMVIFARRINDNNCI